LKKERNFRSRGVFIWGSSAYQIVPFGKQQVFNRFDTAVPHDGKEGAGSAGGPAPNQPLPILVNRLQAQTTSRASMALMRGLALSLRTYFGWNLGTHAA
jgi:hypothetical protein